MRYILIRTETVTGQRRELRKLLGRTEGRIAWLMAKINGDVFVEEDYELVLVDEHTAVLRMS